MTGLTFDRLRALDAVVELSSFTAAARRLNLSQSAVSVQIRELEAHCGVVLVERLGKRAYATPAGRIVLDHARRIAEESDAIAIAMRRFKEGWIGRVQIGAALTALMYLLPPVLHSLHAAHPGIDLVVNNAPTTGMVEAVLQNELDIALVTLPVADKRLRVTPLYREDLVAILPKSQRVIPERVTPDYVGGQLLVLELGGVSALTTHWLAARFVEPRATMRLSAVEAIKIVVAAGLGMAVVPAMAVAQTDLDIVVRPLDPPLTRTLALIQHRSKPPTRALRIVRDALLTLRNLPGRVTPA